VLDEPPPRTSPKGGLDGGREAVHAQAERERLELKLSVREIARRLGIGVGTVNRHGDATLADASLDRLVHNAHRLKLTGDSVRRADGKLTRARKGGEVNPGQCR